MVTGVGLRVFSYGISVLGLFASGALVACSDEAGATSGDDPSFGGAGASGGPTTPAPAERTSPGPKLDCGGGPCVVTSMAMGTLSACVLLSDRTLACYGGGVVGTLGRGAPVEGDPFPQRVKDLSDVTAVYAGAYDVCAVKGSGDLWCWGADQSANPFSTRPGAMAPAKVDGLAGVTRVSISLSHTCAVAGPRGEVFCWGSNYLGELGDGTFTNAAKPVKVQGLADVAQVAVGNEFSCARKKDGQVLCWGGNGKGQLGTADEGHATPAPVPGVGPAIDLSATASAETACAALADRTVTCWGEKWKGPVAGVTGVKELRLGWTHACALGDGGKVTCWGDNGRGQLGNGSRGDGRSGPSVVQEIEGATSLVVMGHSACAVFAEGWIGCWGDNKRGQLGDGTVDTMRPTPVRVRH
jgi:alpha-tubulin suppressor-like RCC1 family protein